MRLRAKTDMNHAEIVRALRQAGCSVLDLSRVGGGCPDLLVARAGYNVLIEVKRPKAKGDSGGRLTPEQEVFMQMWRGKAVVVDSVDAALKAVGLVGRAPYCPPAQNGANNSPWED